MRMPETRNKESGQTLLTSLILLFMIGSSALFFMFLTESAHEAVHSQNKLRQEALVKAKARADILNQIAANNRNMLVSLAVAVNAYVEAVSLGALLSITRTGIDTQSGMRGLEANTIFFISGRSGLRNNPRFLIRRDSDITEMFSKLSERAARGLKLANGIARLNAKLRDNYLREFGLANTPLFKLSTPANALCLAAQTGMKQSALSFDVTNCDVALRNSHFSFNIAGANFGIGYRGGFALLGQRLAPRQKGPEDDFGLTFLNIDQSATFLRSLRSAHSENPNPGAQYSAFLEVVKGPGLGYFTAAKRFDNVPLTLESAVAHPDLRVRSNCDGAGAELFNAKDWRQAENCGVERDLFIRALLKSNWTPIISKELRGGLPL